MRLGIFAKTFESETPLAVLSAAWKTGFDAVQYNTACSGLGALPFPITKKAVADVCAASLAAGVGIVAVSATDNMIHPDPDPREAGRAAFGAIVGTARATGTRLVTVCTGSHDAQDQWRHHPGNAEPKA